jgi:hypothetical protein
VNPTACDALIDAGAAAATDRDKGAPQIVAPNRSKLLDLQQTAEAVEKLG